MWLIQNPSRSPPERIIVIELDYKYDICHIGDGDLDEFDGVKWKDDEPKELILKQ